MQQPICVTGASGFIAAHIVRELLEQGRHVRGTVRSLSKPERYDYLTGLPGADERLELVAAELLTPGAYHEAVAGCRGVIHTASPYAMTVDDPQRDLVDPALQGTRNVLEACAETDTIERVVLTSSLAAISDEPDNDRVFTEADWNDRSTLTRNPYYLSKTLAERAAWDFVAERAPRWDLVAVNPYITIGPSLGPALNTSNGILKSLLTGGYPAILALSWGFVDVRDAAHAHVLALDTPEASGRYICAGETLSMAQVVAFLRESGLAEGHGLPSLDLSGSLGTLAVRLASYAQAAGVGAYLRTHLGAVMRYDNTRIQRELGVTFRPARDSIADAVPDLERWGHLKP